MQNADVCRTQEMLHVIYIFFGSSVAKVQPCQVSSLWDKCNGFKIKGGGRLSAPSPSVRRPEKAHTEYG